MSLKYPVGLAVAESGVMYVSDSCISLFTSEGGFVRLFGRRGRRAGEFEACCGLALDQSGVVCVCDCKNNNIQVYLRRQLQS